MVNVTDGAASTVDAVSEQKTHGKKRRSWGSIFWGLVVIAGLIFVLLPTLLSSLCTSPDALAWISGQPPGRVQVGRAMLGWQSPVLLRDVIYNDDQGRPLAQVDSVTTKRSFWDFLVQPKKPLQLTLDGLRFSVVVEDPAAFEGGTVDLHQAVKAVQTKTLPAIGPEMDLVITNGVIEFRTPKQEVIETWSGWNATYQASGSAAGKQSVKATLPASEELKTGVLELSLDRTISSERAESISLNVHGDRVSLRPALPWLAHYLGPQQNFQYATGTIQAAFERNPATGWQLVSTVGLQEPSSETARIDASIECRFAASDDLISLGRLEVSAPATGLQLQGKITEVSKNQVLDLTGKVETNGAALLDLLPEKIRQEVHVTGMRVSEITLKGALAPQTPEVPPVAASMTVEWDQAVGYGLQSPRGTLKVAYQNGLIIPTPLNVSVNGGRLLKLPVIDLTLEQPVVRFQQGVMLENVALTEEVCRGWMKYVSPTLADATSSEGKFTLALHDGVYFVNVPEQSQLGGTLVVFDGKVRPGPLAVQVFSQVGQLEQLVRRIGIGDLRETTLMEIPRDDVNFLLQNGRVYHDEFGVMIRNMRVATTGSVGLDNTLDLKVMMPIPDKWVADAGPVLQALRGEAIELLVQGTLQDPKIDGRPVADFGKRIGAKAATGLIEKLIERRQQRGK